MTAPASYKAFDSGSLKPIPQDAAGYAGTGAGLMYAGPSTPGDTVDVTIEIKTTDTALLNQIRPFVKRSGNKSPFGAGTYEFKAQTKRANEAWQKVTIIGPIRLTGNATPQEIYLSQELNDTNLIAEYHVSKFQL